MAIVRIHLFKATFLGAGQVQRVTGSDEDGAEDGFPGLFQQRSGHAKPLPDAMPLIVFELSQRHMLLTARYFHVTGVNILADNG